MIKCSSQIMAPSILKLFNLILTSEIFPKTWSDGFIYPIFKSGNVLETTNYRGITIANCLGKLFTKILNARLTKYLIDNNIILNNQIGFMPKCRTSDHLLILKTIIDLYKHKRKTLYLCFIDFQKAFDSIYRDGLLLKLRKYNISTKFINILSSMYSCVTARVKTPAGLTNPFPIEIGTRQGCNLSPTLFNLFLNLFPAAIHRP